MSDLKQEQLENLNDIADAPPTQPGPEAPTLQQVRARAETAPGGRHDLRLRLLNNGFAPLPAAGKAIYLDGWQAANITSEAIASWERGKHQLHRNTGIRTKHTPAFDIDIKHQAAAEAVEAMVREHFGARGRVLVRIGNPPKRALLFCTESPFKKISRSLIAADGGAGQKFEFLGDGQQIIAHGTHPDTKQPYAWHGGTPWEVQASALPLITEIEARALVDEATALLIERFDYRHASPESGTGGKARNAFDLDTLEANILDGVELHDSLRDLAWVLVLAGTPRDMALRHLRVLMNASTASRDDRWQDRYDSIPRLVESAINKAARSSAASQFEPVDIGADPGGDNGAQENEPRSPPPRDWGEPADLWAKDEDIEPPALPPGVVPKYIADFANDRGRRLGLEPGAIAAATITALGSLISAENILQMRQLDPHWKVRPIYWCAVIGPPGSRKTPMLMEAMRPVREFEKQLAREQAARDAFAEHPKPVDGTAAAPKEPKRRRKEIKDATVEKIVEIAADNPWGLFCYRDELTGLIGAMDAYRARGGKDRPFWLEAKEGHSWSVDRKTSGSVHAEICAVSLLGGIQNEKLRELVLKEGLANDGFLQRLSPVYLRRAGRGEDIPPDASLDAITADIGPRIGYAPAQVFKFAPDADEELRIVERFAETESERPDVADHMREWLGKLPGEFGRIAFAFHFIKWAVYSPMFGDKQPDAMISKSTASLARRYLTEFVFGHARVLYNQLSGKGESGQARTVAGLIMARGQTSITDRDLQRATKLFRGTAKEKVRQDVMAELDFYNWVRPAEVSLNGRCSRWAVNPAVHDGRFAEIAGAERARREEMREKFR
jgi:Protein of unknown function (DUF3987)/Bifunctional DNA primase/polymerase, N-terminal